MFEAFYEMDNTPFARDLPTDQLYDSSMMQEILGRLKYTAERQLFAVLSGDSGTGKTTTIRKFVDKLDKG
ncbi:AAA family ATPase, partial [Cytobacillus firmus]|nr:AAA family ATPase [Cytobacillus firmus]